MAKGGIVGRRCGTTTNVQPAANTGGGNSPVNVSAFTDADVILAKDAYLFL